MKTFTRLFMAVVAGMLAFSCVTDTTEDLGVNLGEGQSTTLTLSLDESRTYIGGENGNEYPMYWSEGDQISVNGHTSSPLTAKDINGNSATFTIPAVLEGNYCVTYPAAPAGQVKFAAEQTHKNDTTFGDGVATLYGYGSSEGVELKNLTSILKIGVKLPEGAEATTLTKAQISTADRQPIAGDFAMDFANGTFTSTSTSTDVISYSFGEGVQLSNEPTYMHIAVPAGEYNALYVTLYTNKGVMKATVCATTDNPATQKVEKPLAAGVVRSFAVIDFTANTNVFVIDSEEKLFEFAKAVKAGAEEGGTLFTQDAFLVEDITLTKAWETLDWDTTVTTTEGEGDAAETITSVAPVTFYGNGYSISGLNAPLFGTTTASIKGLHLRDVAIELENPNHVGALACNINNLIAVVEHCSAEGSITVNGLNATLRATIGGLVGTSTANQANSGRMAHLHNAIDITFNGDINSGSEILVGGCVGYIHQCYVDNSSNIGKITITTTSATQAMRVGGIAGDVYGVRNSINGVKDDKEKGAISITGPRGATCSAGIVALVIYGGVSDCINYAPVSQGAGSSSNLYIGGIVHRSNSDMAVTNCTNYGDLSQSGAVNLLICIGGVCAEVYDDTDMTNCHNHGALSATPKSTDGVAQYVRIGGLIGQQLRACTLNINGSVDNYCTNTGAITVGGDVGLISISGIISAIDSTANAGATTNLNYVKNSGTITVDVDTATSNSYVGGIVGLCDRYSASKPNSCTVKISNAINSGNITIGSEASTTEYQAINLGGILGRPVTAILTFSNIKNTAKMEFKGHATGDLCLSGLLAALVDTTPDCQETLTNEGEVVFSGKVDGRSCIGGVVGLTSNMMGEGTCSLVNTGDITHKGISNTEAVNGVGGLVGVVSINQQGVKNGRTWCNIVAPEGVPAGAIAGIDIYETDDRLVVVKNCHCGGTISRDGQAEVEITKDNYCDYVYNKPHTPVDIVLAKECGYISSISAEPQFAPAEIEDTEEVYVIDSKEKLEAFAEDVTKEGFTQTKVYFTKDIDMTGETWEPISGYAGEIYGQGKQITGLTAPLFGATQATLIDNLHLVDVKIVDNENFRIGALACELNAASVVVSNCSVSGTMSIDYAGTSRMEIGGMIGYAYNTSKETSTFSNLKSSINITSTSKANVEANYAGVASFPSYGFIKDCQFTGSITLDENVEHKKVNLAGITNYTIKGFVGCINGDKNNPEAGKLSSKATVSELFFVGGIYSGNSKSEKVSHEEGINGCINYAPIHIGGKMTGTYYAFVGGIAGLMHRVSTQVVNCENHGDIEIALQLTNAANTTAQQFAGIGPLQNPTIRLVENCTNYGDITILEEASFNQAPIRIGGVISTTTTHSQGVTFNNLVNYGNIYVDSKLNKIADSHIGGVVGMVVANTELTNSKSVCELVAVYFNKEEDVAISYSNVGMITGSARNATAPNVKNCTVGGKFCNSVSGQGEDKDRRIIELSAGNYFNYIYGSGSGTDWAGTTDYDGCTFEAMPTPEE